MTGKRALLLGICAMLTLILAAGCSDDGGTKTDKGPPNPDIGVTDSTVDGYYPDGPIADQWVPSPDIPVIHTEAGTDLPTGPDGPVADLPVGDTGPLPDGITATNDTCQTAEVVTLASGSATVTASKVGASNALAQCGSDTLGATDLWYKFTPASGKAYKITFKPQGGGGRFAVWEGSSCVTTDVETACGVLGSTYVSGGSSDSKLITATSGGDIYFVADGLSSSYDVYDFTFEVAEYTPPANDPCTGAKQLTLVSGSVTENGDTSTASNEFGTDVTCGGSSAFDGPDLYYKVSLPTGKAYRVTVKPTGTTSWDSAVYAFKASTGCSSGTAIDTACTGYVNDLGGSGDTDAFGIVPTTTEDWIIVVDSLSASGTFTLTIDSFNVPTNDDCSSAQAVTLAGSGKTTVTGVKVGATNTLAQCGSTTLAATDLWYKFTPAAAGKTYKVTFKPDGNGGRFGVWEGTSCVAADVETACGVLGYQFVDGGASFTKVITSTSGDIYFVADGLDSDYDVYGFVFEIEEAVPPANDTCSAAKAITLVSGSATETGDTLAAANDVDLTSSDCTGDTTSGGDVFYKVDLVGGKSYKIELDGANFDEALYVFTDCANVATTCGQGMGADDWSSSAEAVTISPTTNGTYYIAVDGNSTSDVGSYTLKIDELAGNNSCAGATALSFSGGTATATGDTTSASDTVDLSYSGCTGYSTSGNDLFYRVTLTASQQYTITLTPSASWDPALYVFTDCADPDTTCQSGWGSDNVGDGTAESVTITPATTGTFYIAVDSWSSSDSGTFTLEVK